MKRRGFTLVELLIGSIVMLIVIIGALSIYMRSNRVTVDQQQIAEVQHDVRNSMFFMTRDVRMAGVGLPDVFEGYFLEGVDNDPTDTAAPVASDRLKVMGNVEDPLVLKILNYQGASITVSLEDYSFEQFPYGDGFYPNKVVIIFPNPASACRAAEVRVITHVTHDTGGTNEKLNFSPGLAPGIDPPGGLSGTCPNSSDYQGGYVGYVDVKEYWLDQTGNYPGLTAGEDGYIGGGHANILYLTHNAYHYPLAQNIENLQFQYNGDLDNDGVLDGFADWNNTWTIDQVASIRQVRVIILGRTANPVVSVSGTPPSTGALVYRRPALANSPAAATDDMHKRYLLESTANIRNMSLNIYNIGVR